MANTLCRPWLGGSRWWAPPFWCGRWMAMMGTRGGVVRSPTMRMVACGVVGWGTGTSRTPAADVEADPPVRYGWGVALSGKTRCSAHLVIAVR